jgi:hypothetical protein
MSRRLALSCLTSALLLTAALPLVGTASAAACPTWADDAGDAAADPTGTATDGSVDITKVLVEQSSKELRATFTVPELSGANAYTPGDRFQLTMTANDTAVTVVADRDDAGYGDRTGVQVGSTVYRGGHVKYDVDNHQVVLTMPYTVFDTALGKPFKGMQLKTLEGAVRISFGPLASNFFDKAPAPATLALTAGTVCGDGRWGLALVPAVPAAGEITAERPAGSCIDIADDAGDAKLGGNAPTDPDLDITGVSLRSTPSMLLAYLRVPGLTTKPAAADGHRFSIDFTFNDHVFAVAASSYATGNSQSVREALAGEGISGGMVQMSLDTPTAIGVPYARSQATPPYVESGSKAVFDTAKGYVVIGVPVADIQKYGQAPFAGALLKDVVAKGTADFYRNSLIADSTTAANWFAGTNKCFPARTRLALKVAKAGAIRTVTAKLTADGANVARQPVVFTVGSKRTTVVTDAAGSAVLRNVKPGSVVKATFAGAPGYLPTSASVRA